jgi:hypothetical protein
MIFARWSLPEQGRSGVPLWGVPISEIGAHFYFYAIKEIICRIYLSVQSIFCRTARLSTRTYRKVYLQKRRRNNRVAWPLRKRESLLRSQLRATQTALMLDSFFCRFACADALVFKSSLLLNWQSTGFVARWRQQPCSHFMSRL